MLPGPKAQGLAMGNVILSRYFYLFKVKNKNFSLKNWFFISYLEGQVCVFPPYGIWGGIAVYVREL